MSFMTDMEDAAFDYAAELRERGYLDVQVYRYDTPLDNREPFRRDHRTAYGWAVRYTSDPATDAQVWEGSDGQRKGWPAPKFHDRSLTIFTGGNGVSFSADWLQQRHLTEHGGILADFAGEDVVPMYTAAWSPETGANAPLVPSVIMKRFPGRNDDRHPWQLGPARMYHLVLVPAEHAKGQEA